ncbi:MAG TPA: DUF459 domain-containing protein [Actinomycetota bacterium]|nr:DUF459 domain-containing protein [Actinomycetota bacterium]
MARDVLPSIERTTEPRTEDGRPARRRRSAREVGVAIVVCLVVWTLLFAPVLERNAETGPVGARRSVALAVLRPITGISDMLGITPIAEGALRALGDDPDVQAGGELELPDFELPPLPSLDPATPTGPEPAGPGPGEEPGGEAGGDGGRGDGPAEPEIELRTPTSDTPLRVAVVGDSLSQGLGAAIVQAFDPDLARVLALGRQSTGLSRRDYFSWPRAMREIQAKFRPDLLFIMLGTNDAQPQLTSDGRSIPTGSTAWVEAYRASAQAFLRESTASGTHVVWVGLPVVRDRRRWAFYRRVNGIYEDAAAAEPLATYVDAWSTFDDRDGRFTAFVRNERGVLQEMRASDGLHFTPAGYAYLARVAIRAADEAFRMPERSVGFRL